MVRVRRVTVRGGERGPCLSTFRTMTDVQVMMVAAVVYTSPLTHDHLNTVIGMYEFVAVIPAYVLLIV